MVEGCVLNIRTSWMLCDPVLFVIENICKIFAPWMGPRTKKLLKSCAQKNPTKWIFQLHIAHQSFVCAVTIISLLAWSLSQHSFRFWCCHFYIVQSNWLQTVGCHINSEISNQGQIVAHLPSVFVILYFCLSETKAKKKQNKHVSQKKFLRVLLYVWCNHKTISCHHKSPQCIWRFA